MTPAKNAAILSESELGRDLDTEECQALLDVMEARRLADGEELVGEGDVDEAMHLLVEGRLVVTRRGFGGAEERLHVMEPGELAGAMGVVDEARRSATLRASGEATVYSLRRDALETLVDAQPRLVYHIMRAITRKAHAALDAMRWQTEELTNYIVKQHGRY